MAEQNKNIFIDSAKRALEMESQAILNCSRKIGNDFALAAERIYSSTGKLVVTGLGKSGHIGHKISATFASTGTPALFLHPTEALHGDLGVIQKNDVLLAIAFGGETEEVLAVARYAKRLSVEVICITGKLDSSLARLSDVVIDGTVEKEVCPHNLAPTSSTTVAVALGDALAIAVMQARGFGENDFAKLHPGGALGRKLLTVRDLMKSIEDGLPSVTVDSRFHEVLEAVTNKNYGIVPVVGPGRILLGAISDGDIRRALLAQGAAALAMTASQLMTKSPKTIFMVSLAMEAFKKMESSQITSLFVVSSGPQKELLGLIRMHDLLAAKIV